MSCSGNLLLRIFAIEGFVKACPVGLTDSYKIYIYLYIQSFKKKKVLLLLFFFSFFLPHFIELCVRQYFFCINIERTKMKTADENMLTLLFEFSEQPFSSVSFPFKKKEGFLFVLFCF